MADVFLPGATPGGDGGAGTTISPEYVRDNLFQVMYACIRTVNPEAAGEWENREHVYSTPIRGIFLPTLDRDPDGSVERGIIETTQAWFRRFIEWRGYRYAPWVRIRIERCRDVSAVGGCILTLLLRRPDPELRACMACRRCGLPVPCHLSSGDP